MNILSLERLFSLSSLLRSFNISIDVFTRWIMLHGNFDQLFLAMFVNASTHSDTLFCLTDALNRWSKFRFLSDVLAVLNVYRHLIHVVAWTLVSHNSRCGFKSRLLRVEFIFDPHSVSTCSCRYNGIETASFIIVLLLRLVEQIVRSVPVHASSSIRRCGMLSPMWDLIIKGCRLLSTKIGSHSLIRVLWLQKLWLDHGHLLLIRLATGRVFCGGNMVGKNSFDLPGLLWGIYVVNDMHATFVAVIDLSLQVELSLLDLHRLFSLHHPLIMLVHLAVQVDSLLRAIPGTSGV